VVSLPAPSVTPSVALSSSAPSSPTTAGTSPSSAASLPTVLSSSDIAAGVRTTAQEFFDDLNIALATGDVTKYNARTSPGCACRSIALTIKQTYAQGQHIVGVSTTVTSISVVSFVTGGANADVHYTISAGRILDAAGKQVNTSVAQPDGHNLMFIVDVHGSWLVTQSTLLHEGPR
jgi:hypothetical protein